MLLKFLKQFNKVKSDNELLSKNVKQQMSLNLKQQQKIREQNKKLQDSISQKINNYSK